MEDSDEGDTKTTAKSGKSILNEGVLENLLRFGGKMTGEYEKDDIKLMRDNPDFIAHFLRVDMPHTMNKKLLNKIRGSELVTLLETPEDSDSKILVKKGRLWKTTITRETTARILSAAGDVELKELASTKISISWENAEFVFSVYKELVNVLAANEFIRESTIHTPRTLYYYSGDGESAKELSLSNFALYERIIWFYHVRTKNHKDFKRENAQQDDNFHTHPATVIVGCTELSMITERTYDDEGNETESVNTLLYNTTRAMAAPLYITDDAKEMIANKGYDTPALFKEYVVGICDSFVPEMIRDICPKVTLASPTAVGDSYILPAVEVSMKGSSINHFIPMLFGLACSLGGSLYINELMEEPNMKLFSTAAIETYGSTPASGSPRKWIQHLIEWIVVFRTPFFVSFFKDDKAFNPHPAQLSSVKMEELLKSLFSSP